MKDRDIGRRRQQNLHRSCYKRWPSLSCALAATVLNRIIHLCRHLRQRRTKRVPWLQSNCCDSRQLKRFPRATTSVVSTACVIPKVGPRTAARFTDPFVHRWTFLSNDATRDKSSRTQSRSGLSVDLDGHRRYRHRLGHVRSRFGRGVAGASLWVLLPELLCWLFYLSKPRLQLQLWSVFLLQWRPRCCRDAFSSQEKR